jgi:dihydroorotate dehydrogenase
LENIDKIDTNKNIFIKLSPDINNEEIDIILGILEKHRIHGIICSNLTKNRENSKINEEEKHITDKGGISGKAVEDLSDKLISYIYGKTKGKYIIIGVGGVSSGQDAYNKIINGATLIQLITGMIFEGPQVISQINQELSRLLHKNGFKNIKEAIGSGIVSK